MCLHACIHTTQCAWNIFTNYCVNFANFNNSQWKQVADCLELCNCLAFWQKGIFQLGPLSHGHDLAGFNSRLRTLRYPCGVNIHIAFAFAGNMHQALLNLLLEQKRKKPKPEWAYINQEFFLLILPLHLTCSRPSFDRLGCRIEVPVKSQSTCPPSSSASAGSWQVVTQTEPWIA